MLSITRRAVKCVVLVRNRQLSLQLNGPTKASRPLTEPFSIPKLSSPSPSQFIKHVVSAPHTSPHIITGLMLDWPATTKWKSIKHLLTEDTADLIVPVELGPKNVGYNVQSEDSSDPEAARPWQRIETRFRFFVQLLESGWDGAAYVSQLNIDDVPPLKADIHLPHPLAPNLAAPPNLWIGSRDTYTPIHRDILGHNLLFQLLGTKTIRIFPPSEKPSLYISLEPAMRNTSLIPFDHAFDVARWPLFLRGVERWYEATIGPGDAVFIPKGWYHSVRGREESISVNSWFL